MSVLLVIMHNAPMDDAKFMSIEGIERVERLTKTRFRAGTTIIQGVHVGKNCFIGAGSVIIRDIPDNYKAYGVPCKIIEEIK